MEQVNELSEVKATYHLTQSFRFGFEIAYAATMVIDLLKGEEAQALIGNEAVVDSITGSFPHGIIIITTLFRSISARKEPALNCFKS